MQSRLWEDVTEGDQLPTLEVPITIKTFILAAIGTRDLNPNHHNSEWARSAGGRDMWLNTMWHQSLFGRFVTDWTGPDSDFRRTSIHMQGQIYPGDTVVVEGEVTKKFRDNDDTCIEVAITAKQDRGIAARATATMAMPSREAGPVRPRTHLERPHVEPHPEMPDFARAWLGQVSEPLWGAYPISEAQIMYWCDMSQDANPLYEDTEYARGSRHQGMIAPPSSLLTWILGRGGRMGPRPGLPDCDNPSIQQWPPREGVPTQPGPRTTDYRMLSALLSDDWDPPGAKELAANLVIQDYGPPLRPGDRAYSRTEMVNCTPLTRTRLGEGYFQTVMTSFYNQHDVLVGVNQYTFFRYGKEA